MIAVNGDIRIEWDDHGSGDPLLLIQGLGYARWGWDPLIGPLAEHFRVITFDNRGIGGSTIAPGPYTAAEMATDALAVLNAAGVGSAHIAGTSLGGMIAQELAIDTPERVARLVLICTTPGLPDAYPIPTATLQLIAESVDMEPAVALRKFVVNALGPEPGAELIEDILQRRLANPPNPTGWGAQAAVGAGYTGGDRATQIAAPTLLISGTEDKVIDHRNSQLLAELIPDSTLLLIPDAGHLVFWEEPDRVADAIIEFLP